MLCSSRVALAGLCCAVGEQPAILCRICGRPLLLCYCPPPARLRQDTQGSPRKPRRSHGPRDAKAGVPAGDGKKLPAAGAVPLGTETFATEYQEHKA